MLFSLRLSLYAVLGVVISDDFGEDFWKFIGIFALIISIDLIGYITGVKECRSGKSPF